MSGRAKRLAAEPERQGREGGWAFEAFLFCGNWQASESGFSCNLNLWFEWAWNIDVLDTFQPVPGSAQTWILRVFRSILAFVVAAMLAGAAQARQVSVSPRPAQALSPVQLPALIASLLPSKGATRLSWNYVRSAPIKWMSAGPQRENTQVVRKAVARVRVGSWWGYYIHHGRRVELAWWVTLENRSGLATEPEVIEINPDSEGSCSLKTYHMDGGFGCAFTGTQAVAGRDLHSRRLCSAQMFSDKGAAYRITAPGKHSAVLVYTYSVGTGFATSWLEIFPFKTDAAACAELAKQFAY